MLSTTVTERMNPSGPVFCVVFKEKDGLDRNTNHTSNDLTVVLYHGCNKSNGTVYCSLYSHPPFLDAFSASKVFFDVSGVSGPTSHTSNQVRRNGLLSI